MKRTRMTAFCLLTFVCLAVVASAEVPNQISYQGRLTDNDGNPVPDGNYNLTFQIVEHDPLPMGESPLWSSGVQTVTVTDGLFVYYLGSNVPIPASILTDDGLESHYLRTALEGSPVYSSGIRLASVPFAIRAASSDTAAYAHAGPGSGATGWVDDGSVVRLQSGGDRVGIGTSSPSENLVVGSDLGSFPEASYVVAGNSNFEEFSGFKLGWNADNHATINWLGDGDQLRFSTRSLGTSYNNTMTMRAGNVGINNDYPDEPLVIGAGFGTSFGDMIQISRTGAGRYSGMMFGEDSDNRGQILWYNNSNELRLGYFSGGTNYTSRLVLKSNQIIVNGDPVDESMQLPNNAISSVEVLNESGIGYRSTGYTTMNNDGWHTVGSIGVEAPAAGYILIFVTLGGRANLPNSSGNFARYKVCVSDTASGCDINSPDTWEWYWWGESFKGNVGAIQKLYPVSSAGTYIYYVNAEGYGHDNENVLNAYLRANITALYLPTWYDNGSPPSEAAASAPSGSTFPRSSNADAAPMVYRTDSHYSNTKDLRAEFDAKLKSIAEEFQRKLEELRNNK